MLGGASMTVGVLGRAGAPAKVVDAQRELPTTLGEEDSEALCRGMGRRWRLGVAAAGLGPAAGELIGINWDILMDEKGVKNWKMFGISVFERI